MSDPFLIYFLYYNIIIEVIFQDLRLIAL